MAQNDRVFDWDFTKPDNDPNTAPGTSPLTDAVPALDFANLGDTAPAIYHGEPPANDQTDFDDEHGATANDAEPTAEGWPEHLPGEWRTLFSPNLTAIGLGMVCVWFLWQLAAAVAPIIIHGLVEIVAATMAGAVFFVSLLVKALAVLAVAVIVGVIISAAKKSAEAEAKRPGTLPPDFVRRHPTRSGNVTANTFNLQVNVNQSNQSNQDFSQHKND